MIFSKLNSTYDLINFIIEYNKDDIVLFLYELLEMEEYSLVNKIIQYLIYNHRLIIESELIYFADYVKIAKKNKKFKEFLITIIPNIIKYHIPLGLPPSLLVEIFEPLIFDLLRNNDVDIASLIEDILFRLEDDI